MSCRYADLDGVYVLGALPPGERRDYELHLPGCDACSRSVRELAGLPGLLGRVDAEALEVGQDEFGESTDPPVPDTLLPTLVRHVRRRRRRRQVALGSGLAAAVLAGALAWSQPGVIGRGQSPEASAPPAGSSSQPSAPARAMVPVGAAPVTATVAVQRTGWGSRLELTCAYERDQRWSELPPELTYALVVRSRDGRSEQVGTWRVTRGTTMRLSAATSARPEQISSVEVRTSQGRTVLRLPG